MKHKNKINTELKVKNDVIFKELFSKKGNEIFLQDFLSSLLKIEIKKIEITKEVQLPIDNIEQNQGIIDIKATLEDETIINIEMQIKNKNNMKKRALYYGCKLVSSQLKKGEVYEDIKDVIVISILDYNILKTKKYITKFSLVSKQEKEEKIEGLKLYFIELPKFRKEIKKKEKYNKLEEWLIFIDGKEEEKVSTVIKENKIIKKAKEEAEYLTGKEAKMRWAELREKWERDYNSEMSYSFKKGEKKKSIDIARNMLKKNSDIQFISDVTKLSIKEIEKLKK